MNPPGAERLSVLVVDDELPARQRLLDLLARERGIERVLEAENGVVAFDLIRATRPHLVFLDIQMPAMDGWTLLQRLDIASMPIIIFVTAYDQYAIRAFEANALDYLLKPYSDERFESTWARARAQLEQRQFGDFGRQLVKMMGGSPVASAYLDRIVVKSAGAARFLPVNEIDWIEAAGVYVTLHLGAKEHLHRSSLTELAIRLDPTRFVRVHRSAIVNVASIVRLDSASHGEFDAVLKNGARPRVSRHYRVALEKVLGQPL